MNKIVYSIAASFLLLSSCGKEKPKEVKSENISLVIGNPLNYGQKNVLLFPVGGNYNPSITEGHSSDGAFKEGGKIDNKNISFFSRNEVSEQLDKSASYEYMNKREEEFDIRNLLFYNQVTRTTYPLVKDTIHILSFAIHNEFTKPLIFFRIV